eukprot:1157922-Pelagomonas_calceolata.AAC.10
MPRRVRGILSTQAHRKRPGALLLSCSLTPSPCTGTCLFRPLRHAVGRDADIMMCPYRERAIMNERAIMRCFSLGC